MACFTFCRKKTSFFFFSLFSGYLVQLGVVCGALIGQPFLLGSRDHLFYLFALPAVFPLAMLLAARWLPRTPLSLLVREIRCQDDDEDDDTKPLLTPPSLATLRRLRSSSHDVDAELKEMREALTKSSSRRMGLLEMMRSSRGRRRQWLSSMLLATSVHLTLITSFNFYSSDLLIRAGADPEHASYYTLGEELFRIKLQTFHTSQ